VWRALYERKIPLTARTLHGAQSAQTLRALPMNPLPALALVIPAQKQVAKSREPLVAE
jgi:hypothetical protein